MTSKKQKKKGFLLPNPVTGYDLIDVCLKIPDAPEYRRAFLGHINQLGEWFIWEKSYLPDDTRARDAAQLWRDTLYKYLMMGDDCMNGCCNDPPPLYRYTPTGTLEQSTDGGATWTDATSFDPRFNSPQFPPMTGDDGNEKRCLAAVGAGELMKQQVADQLTDDMSRYTLTQLINDWLNTVTQDGGNILQGLVTIITNQTFAVTVAAIRAALTDAVWGSLECILYDHIESDASYTTADWQAVKNDIASKISGIASLFLQQLVNVLGATGLTNLARSGGVISADCSTCGSGCPDLLNWTTVPPGINNGVIDMSTLSTVLLDATGHVQAGDSEYYIQIQSDGDMACCTPSLVEWTGNSFSMLVQYNLCGETRATWSHTAANPGALAGLDLNAIMLRTVDPNSIKIHI